MNMKLILLGSIALTAIPMIQACHLKVSNDTNQTVVLQSHKEGKDRLVLKPRQTNVPFGKQDGTKGEMADFELTVVGSDAKPIRVVQKLCSIDFQTHLTASEVVNKKFSDVNTKLFTFDNVQSGTCGCSADKKVDRAYIHQK